MERVEEEIVESHTSNVVPIKLNLNQESGLARNDDFPGISAQRKDDASSGTLEKIRSPVSGKFEHLSRLSKGFGFGGENEELGPRGSIDHMLSRIRQQLARASKNNLVDESASKATTPPLSSSSFSQLILDRAFKGKGKNPETRPTTTREISLREYLRSGNAKREKLKGIVLFKHLVELVDSAHSQGFSLKDMRPSLFSVSQSDKLTYIGSFAKKDDSDSNKKRHLSEEASIVVDRDFKQRKLSGHYLQVTTKTHPTIDKDCYELQQQYRFSLLGASLTSREQCVSSELWLEEQWYTCPEELGVDDDDRFKSNIYSLGVLLFELLCDYESIEMYAAMMADLRRRILPPSFLSQNIKEAGFLLWLLHPEPSSRPSAREILQSELLREDDSAGGDDDEEMPELLLHFLAPLKKQKQKHASKLLQDIQTLEEDIKEAERRYSSNPSLTIPREASETRFETISNTLFVPTANSDRLISNIRQIEEAYFFMRSQMNVPGSTTSARSDKRLLKDRDTWSDFRNEKKEKSSDQVEVFFEGLCKFARYSKFETCGTIRSGDLLNSTGVICSLSFDPDEEHIAAAGISKKIKIFDFDAFTDDSVGVHYPLVEMCNETKLSCVCWNSYIKNYLASTDYDGVVQIWDAGTGQGFSQHAEHKKRAWSVDFSPSDPTKFVSGSDDCSVKLWSINDKRSTGTIWSPANVCCVQFSASSSHLLAFGSADYKVYCYDLRYNRFRFNR